jgi:hypothetical protein
MASTKMIGAYLEPGAISDEDVKEVFDRFQNVAHVRNLFFRAYVFNNEIVRPDRSCSGGAFFQIHPEYYEKTFIRDFQGEEGDLLARVMEEVGRRDMGVYVYFFPAKTAPSYVPGYESALEVDCYGNRASFMCWRNPDYKEHLLGAARDVLTNYPVLGLMWGAERCGPVGWLVLKGPGRIKPACFCEHCCRAAEERGIDPERGKEAWQKVCDLFGRTGSGNKPPEGAFVNFWRLLLRYPEILQWEALWWDGKRDVQKEIYAIGKSIRGGLTVGHHMWHRGRAFSPFNRAALDYEELSEFADFVKPAMFSNPAPFRFKEQLDGQRASVLGDLSDEQASEALFRFLGYDRECAYEELTTRVFSPRYVYREIEMAKAVVGDRIPVYAGLNGGTYRGYAGIHDFTPDGIAGELRAVSEAGADGVIYDGIDTPELAKAVGKTLKKEGWI